MKSDYIAEAVDARDILRHIIGKHHKWALEPTTQLVEFSIGKRDWSISLQTPELRANFTGSLKRARERIAEGDTDD